MTRTLRLVALAAASLALALPGAATAGAQEPARDLPSNGGVGVRTGNVTATGATVPNPGEPQSSGVTPLDRNIQREDSRITGSICKGC